MKLIKVAPILAILLFCPMQGVAQPPPSGQLSTILPLSQIPLIQTLGVDQQQLLLQDRRREEMGLPPRFATSIPLSLSPQLNGIWRVLPSGNLLWSLRVRSPGALSLNFVFNPYHMPSGGRLFISTPDGSHRMGPFTDGDNESHGQLWTPVLPGEEAVLQLEIPPSMLPFLRLRLAAVNHGYREFPLLTDTKSGDCNVDVACPEAAEWTDEVRSVARVTIGGTTLCTGTLLNNTSEDLRPLFLTADHCGVDDQTAPSMVFYWNFQKSSCGGPADGTLQDFQTGAIFRAGWDLDQGTDFALVELDDPPDPLFSLYWAGWDRTEADPPAAVTIHHPSGDEKSISFENDPLTTTSLFEDTSPGDGLYLRVGDWDLGTTEPGSSGAGLWNPDHRLVGQLTGGTAACGNDEPDWFGRLSASWEGGGTPQTRLKDWLDPAGTEVLTLDGRDSCTPPSVDFTVDPNPALVGEPVSFQSSVAGGAPPYTYSWDLDGDGEIDCTTQDCIHTYDAPFNGNATLWVTDSQPCPTEATHAVAVLPPEGELTLLDPNGGEVLPSGTSFTIRWRAPSEARLFTLKYSLNNGRSWKTLVRDIAGDHYEWMVPTPRRNSPKSLVKILAFDEAGKRIGTDRSDGRFTIEVVRVLSPNGGETLVAGTAHQISWTTHATKEDVVQVKLLYSLNGKQWHRIAVVEGDPGSFLWTVPQVPAPKDRCRVKVKLYGASGRSVGKDLSDAPFTILPSSGLDKGGLPPLKRGGS
jgi:hypothetical protein